MEKLRKATLKYLEQQLEDYQTINDEIARRMLVLDFPWQESDTNIGGGRGSKISKEPESIMFRHMSDTELQTKLALKENCSKAVKIFEQDNQQYEIYKLRFLSSNYYSWREIADIMHFSVAMIYKKRYRLLKVLADIQGIKE
ncbi:hypothetical protein [Companilactobacillus furfuricola]|uniref:hypothetical protein n=1 Tax=Companilactobacillus furfuricola TaxID=1462575 RepID=UPI000F7BAF43|nr:hypothetical protein [Companilactobacillus furfuricola]